jgi:uncharacterized protein
MNFNPWIVGVFLLTKEVSMRRAHLFAFLWVYGTGLAPVVAEPKGCSERQGRAEQLICSDPELSSLDTLLGRVFADSVKANPKSSHSTVKKELAKKESAQREWLSTVRDACSDLPCLKEAYYARLEQLDSFTRKDAGAAQNLVFVGVWERRDPTGFEPSQLTVRQESPGAFNFSFTASNGARSGEFTGLAQKSSNSSARYAGDLRCEIRFARIDHKEEQVLNVSELGCSDFAGVGVSLAGEYTRAAGEAEAVAAPEKLFLKNGEQNTAFRALVGEDYPLFLDTAHVVSDLPDEDGFGSTVQAFVVRSLSAVSESIVMIGKNGELWAAVIEPVDGSTDRPRVRYYTNQEGWRNRLPITIESWRKGFKDNSILFVSLTPKTPAE